MDAQHCSLKLRFNQGLWAASALLPLGSSSDCQLEGMQVACKTHAPSFVTTNWKLQGMHVLTQLRRFVALGCDHMEARCTCVICYSTSKPLHKPQRHLLFSSAEHALVSQGMHRWCDAFAWQCMADPR